MQDYPLNLDASLRVGLRPDSRRAVGSPGLVRCKNARPTPGGLEGITPVVQPWVGSVTWPFPQVIRGFNAVWLADESSIHRLADDWTLEPAVSYVTPGLAWSAASHGSYIILTNGAVTARIAPETDDLAVVNDSATNLYDSTIPLSTHISEFKGRLVASGIQNPNGSRYGSDEAWIAISKPGSADFTIDASNLSFWRPMPSGGSVRGSLRLVDVVMVYADDSVYALRPADASSGLWELRRIAENGLLCPTAFCGDVRRHIWIDADGWLWSIDAAMNVKRLGYRDYFLPIRNANPRISYNASKREFYICTDSVGYVLTESGLGEITQMFTSGYAEAGSWIAPVLDLGDRELLVVNDTITGPDGASASISWIAVSGDGLTGAQAGGYWSAGGDVFAPRPWAPLDVNGNAFVPLAGARLRPAVRIPSPDGENTRITGFSARRKSGDRRFARGPSAIPSGVSSRFLTTPEANGGDA